MRGRIAVAIVAVGAFAAAAHAITFRPASKPDPFALGKSCDTPMLSSYGDYVYEWSSKYDLIFSPQDYPMWIWRCETSGYASFPGDFETVTAAERPKIAAYLAQANFGPRLKGGGITPELQQHLEKLYALREMDDQFRAFFMRWQAWQYRAKPIADEYRKKAFDIHLKLLDSGKLAGDELLDTLYVLGFYSYKFGRVDDAKRYFARLKNTETIDPKTKQPRRGAPYLEKLATEVLAGKADAKVRFANDQN